MQGQAYCSMRSAHVNRQLLSCMNFDQVTAILVQSFAAQLAQSRNDIKVDSALASVSYNISSSSTSESQSNKPTMAEQTVPRAEKSAQGSTVTDSPSQDAVRESRYVSVGS